jgi:hypothetical protein
MKAYGIRKKDDDCCIGHAKYPRKRPRGCMNWGKSKTNRLRKPAKTRARREGKVDIEN